uniref:Uncharacterized protein n=1 Tax=Anguilla anguilla TaxID=7936 RepID=A0A0E9SHZ6_ANGAN
MTQYSIFGPQSTQILSLHIPGIPVFPFPAIWSTTDATSPFPGP